MSDAGSLTGLLVSLGVRRGGVLMVHASLSGAGLGPSEVRDALLAAVGPHGTLVTPTFTPENSDTSRVHRTLIEGWSEEEIREFRAKMPPFLPEETPCPTMGALAEAIRTTPGARRSTHPQSSLAGLGPRAAELLARHHPHCHLGEESPLAALYEADAQVLLLRAGFEACTAFHLAEYRVRPPLPTQLYRCVTGAVGNWTSYKDLVLDDSDFAAIGARLPKDLLAEGEWAGKPVVVVRMRDAVDNAVLQMYRYRTEIA
ncbi:aminoglycoside N(3)-acetyltransferase [Streptomyces sp. NPDC013157]|uniref:aminoglycoside N(3)-acetyltransferase n=1 Tax=Streptomyces sp. NPDC013157 TaxID=3364861 RepID=UPI0036BE9180